MDHHGFMTPLKALAVGKASDLPHQPTTLLYHLELPSNTASITVAFPSMAERHYQAPQNIGVSSQEGLS